MLACFFAGYFAVTMFSLGRIVYDDREGPGWSPITKMADGKTGLSQSALETIGFFALGVGLAALIGLIYVWIHLLRPLMG
jgi:hypothetical protein